MTEADSGSPVSLEIFSWISFYKLELLSGHGAIERELLLVHQEMGDIFYKGGNFEHVQSISRTDTPERK